MKEKVRKMVMELLNDECYDMQDEFTDEEIAEAVGEIVAKFNGNRRQVVHVSLCGNMIKVRNAKHWSFVSFSTGEFTGLSESEAEIIDLSKPIDADGVKNLVEMINAAWYAAVS